MRSPSRSHHSPEPWHATLNGTLYAADGILGAMDDPKSATPGIANEREIDNAARAAACVNALTGVLVPAAIPRLLEAVQELLRISRSFQPRPKDISDAAIVGALIALRGAVDEVGQG